MPTFFVSRAVLSNLRDVLGNPFCMGGGKEKIFQKEKCVSSQNAVSGQFSEGVKKFLRIHRSSLSYLSSLKLDVKLNSAKACHPLLLPTTPQHTKDPR